MKEREAYIVAVGGGADSDVKKCDSAKEKKGVPLLLRFNQGYTS
jgi:hypothetical protein